MSVVKINAVTVPADQQARFEERFRGRAGAVEKTPGFEWFELLAPAGGHRPVPGLHPLEQRGGLPVVAVRAGLRPRARGRRRHPRPRRGPVAPPLVLRGAGVRRAARGVGGRPADGGYCDGIGPEPGASLRRTRRWEP